MTTRVTELDNFTVLSMQAQNMADVLSLLALSGSEMEVTSFYDPDNLNLNLFLPHESTKATGPA